MHPEAEITNLSRCAGCSAQNVAYLMQPPVIVQQLAIPVPGVEREKIGPRSTEPEHQLKAIQREK